MTVWYWIKITLCLKWCQPENIWEFHRAMSCSYSLHFKRLWWLCFDYAVCYQPLSSTDIESAPPVACHGMTFFLNMRYLKFHICLFQTVEVCYSTFAPLWNAYYKSLCPAMCTNKITWHLPNEFALNLIVGNSSKICWPIPVTDTLHEGLLVFMCAPWA